MGRVSNIFFLSGPPFGFLLSLSLILTPSFLYAREIVKEDVRIAVETWVRHVTADAKPDAVIEKIKPHKIQGETVAYIVHFIDDGFCLCGADDLVLPVYFYSPRGTYDQKDPNMNYILWEISTRLKHLKEGLKEKDPKLQEYQEALKERSAFWHDLIQGQIPDRTVRNREVKDDPIMMELSLTSKWNQGGSSPGSATYNAQCPVLNPPNEHTVVGCVATATSQIMYYWEWPATGENTGQTKYNYRWRSDWDEEALSTNPVIPSGYPWNDRLRWIDTPPQGGRLQMNGYWDESLYDKAKTLSSDGEYLSRLEDLWNDLTHEEVVCSVDFGSTPYHWSLMRDQWSSLPPGGGDAMAMFCYHVGVALNMDYGIKGSTASAIDIDNVLEDHCKKATPRGRGFA